MPSEVSIHVTHQEGLHFVGANAAGCYVDMDTAADSGGGAGPTPMELVLMSLAGCSAMDVIAILRKQRQPVEGLEVRVRGRRRDEHATVFTAITLEYLIHGADVEPDAVARAITLSKERYCPVWAMLAQSVEISSAFRVVSDSCVPVPAD